MYRFIDLRGRGTCYNFAFFDTISDRFVEGDNCQGWNDILGIQTDPKLTPRQKEVMIALIPEEIKNQTRED